MTKQEQIEEMSRKIYYARSKVNGIATSSDIAEALYKAGYRKIDNKASLKNEIKHLNTIVERLDELLAKGIDEYIMGIDGVEGLKDMWERSAVMAFAEKVKEEVYPFLQAEMYNEKHFITGDLISDKLLENQNIGILKAQDVLSKWFKVKIDELLKEYGK